MDRAKRYNTIRLVLSLSLTALGWVFLLLIVTTGFSVIVERWAYSIFSSSYLALLIFGAVIGIMTLVLFFPLSFYTGYVLEHRYGLSTQSVTSYLWERIKGILVAVVIGIPLFFVFYFFLNTYENYWWIPVGLFAFFFSVILGKLAPVLIFPLFYRFVPLENEEIADRVRQRCESVGMKVEGVFQFDLSKTTRKANAAFTGIGKSKRILLGDNLVDNFPVEEIDAVVAHELGHFKKKHLWKMMGVAGALTFLGLYIVSVVYSEWSAEMGFESITRLAALPLLGLLLGIYGFVTGPVQNAISRHHERVADHFSREMLGGNEEPLVAALERLADMNLSDRSPHPIVEFLFHSHPSVKHRIGYLKT